MDFTKSTSSRLRRTFAYPSDTTTPDSHPDSDWDSNDDDNFNLNSRAALDEQEQEDLIKALSQQNAARNAQFRLALLSIPALSALPYLALLVGCLGSWIGERRGGGGGNIGGDGGGRERAVYFYTAILALSSLASTAWSLYSLPPVVTGIRLLDEWASASSSSAHSKKTSTGAHTDLSSPLGSQRRRRLNSGTFGSSSSRTSAPFWSQQHRSPLEQYLPFLNVGLCAVLVLTGFLSSLSQSQTGWENFGLANLPAMIYAVVLAAKMVMAGVDPETELAALRYEYKGA
ncbi:hypothetical protein F5Y16DRAFT_152842 [Xylariaceae sp. FL0255]|nr:hypothetical protein F5Y16DRAFT_152842 [Xylariaceae sp. FL0255]